MPTVRSRPLAAPAFAAVLVLGACAATDPATADAWALRTTLAADTGTAPEGTLELEAGLQVDPGDEEQSSLTLLYGLSERSELALGAAPVVHAERPGADAHGLGDVEVAWTHRVIDPRDHRPSWALRLATSLPTSDADEGTGSGEIGFFAAALASREKGRTILSGVYELGLLGEADSSGTDVEHTLAVSGLRLLGGGWSAFGELAVTIFPADSDEHLFSTLGVNRALTASLVLDFGLVVPLHHVVDDDDELQLFIGLTSTGHRVHAPRAAGPVAPTP